MGGPGAAVWLAWIRILLKSRLEQLQLAGAELAVIQQGSVVMWAGRRR